MYLESLQKMDGVESLAAFRSGHFNLTGHGDARRLDGLYATPELFRVAGVHALFGPGFDAVSVGEEQIAVISWRLWNGTLGADPGVVGSTLVLNDEPYQVTGVMPEGFAFPAARTCRPHSASPPAPTSGCLTCRR